jgi:hypothetical protein
LGFDPIDVVFLVEDEMFEQLPARVVVNLEAGLYAWLENG